MMSSYIIKYDIITHPCHIMSCIIIVIQLTNTKSHIFDLKTPPVCKPTLSTTVERLFDDLDCYLPIYSYHYISLVKQIYHVSYIIYIMIYQRCNMLYINDISKGCLTICMVILEYIYNTHMEIKFIKMIYAKCN